MDQEHTKDKRQAKRETLQTRVEFIVNADVILAESIDISESGIRIETDAPINISMRLSINGKIQDCQGQLVWARKNESGGLTYGFKYVDDKAWEDF